MIVLVGGGDKEMMSLLMAKLSEGRKIFLVESSIEKLRTVISDSKNPNCHYAAALGSKNLHEAIESIIFTSGCETLDIVLNPMRQGEEETFKKAFDIVTIAHNSLRNTTHWCSHYWKTSANSLIKNFKNAKRSTPWQELAKQIKPQAAFCIGAGPSLDRDIEHLKGARDKGLIIAADAALPPLLAAGIEPDIVCSIDVIDKKAQIFRDHKAPNSTLVATMRTHSDMVEAWQGPFVMTSTGTYLENWYADRMDGIPRIDTPSNVMHMAFNLAAALPCSPVILVGVDLCDGPDGEVYAKGVTHHTAKEQAAQAAFRSDENTIETNCGGRGRAHFGTSLLFVNAFERMAKHVKNQLFTTAKHGAKINGFNYQPLQTLLTHLPCISREQHINLNPRPMPTVKDSSELIQMFLELKVKLSCIPETGKEIVKLLRSPDIATRVVVSGRSDITFRLNTKLRKGDDDKQAIKEAFNEYKETAQYFYEALSRSFSDI